MPRGKPPTVKGRDILARAAALPDHADDMPDGSEPTPAQASVNGPGKLTDTDAAKTAAEQAEAAAKAAAAKRK